MTTAPFPDGCAEPEKGRLLDDYLNGELTEAQAGAFEEHYFVCSACLEAIRVRQTGPRALIHWKRVASRRLRYLLALLGAVLVVAATSYVACGYRGSNPFRRNRVGSLAELRHVAAPQYLPSGAVVSGDAAQQAFAEAMRFYTAGDLGGAVPGLEASWKADPSRAETGFYLGASYLITNRVDRAIETLRATMALGQPPFLDPAGILLAKAYVRREAFDDARRALRDVAGRAGASRAEAESLLELIDRRASGKP